MWQGGGDYRGIGLVEVVWNVVMLMMTLNCRVASSIAFHNVFHGFQAGRDTGTTFLEAKLIQQLTDTREELFNIIFMDLHKVCCALDRDIFLYVLQEYGLGTQDHCALCAYCYRTQMVACYGGYCGAAF